MSDPTSKTTRPPPLSELKLVVKHDMPSDELWVHPSMFILLKYAFLEADNMRDVRKLIAPFEGEAL